MVKTGDQSLFRCDAGSGREQTSREFLGKAFSFVVGIGKRHED
jgi:hypothetical protein